jgi:hypothetical protein
MALKGENLGGESFFFITTIVLFILPIVTMIIGSKMHSSTAIAG